MIRALLSSLVERCLRAVEPHLPRPRIIFDRAGVSPYLSRYYLTGRPRMPDGSAPFAAGQARPGILWPSGPIAVYLHRFHRGDEDKALHNHPWRWALSLVLTGGYSEERRVGGAFVVQHIVRPLSFNWIGHDDFHRVDLLEADCWTLFISGPKVSSWGFWDRHTGEFIPWREFITRKRGEGWQPS